MAFDENRLGAFHVEQEATVFCRSWFTDARQLLTLTPYPSGVSFSHHLPADFLLSGQFHRGSSQAGVAAVAEIGSLNTEQGSDNEARHLSQFDLRLPDLRHSLLPPGNYWAYRGNFQRVLKSRFRNLQESGELDQTAVVFGLTSDPFHHAERTGTVASACIKLLNEYTPGLLLIQTRSPKLLASPDLWTLPRERTVVVVPLETSLQSAVDRYTPGLTPLRERLAVIERLKEEGFTVHIKVSPVLPYGDFYRDSWKFAEILARYGSYVSFASVADFLRHPRTASIALRQRLQIDRQIKFLEPFAYRSVYYALQSLAVHKLQYSSPFPRKTNSEMNGSGAADQEELRIQAARKDVNFAAAPDTEQLALFESNVRR